LNDQGRLVSKEESVWIDLKPVQKQKSSVNMDLKLNDNGSLTGVLSLKYFGYGASDERGEWQILAG